MSTTEQKALARVEAYLQRRSTANGIDREEIHSFDTGPETGIYLLASDLAELCRLSAENEALRSRMDTTLTMVEQANRTSTELLRERDELRAQVEALTKPAARWHWLSDHMRVSWSEGKFTSLVRIVSEEWRTSINAAVDRMMAGDWPDADHTPTPSPLTRPASAIAQEARGYVREITTAWDRDNLHDCINRLEEMASRQTQTAALTRPAVPVGSWAWLRGVIGGLAKHQHKMEGTGQTHTFIVRDDVMGWIEEGEKRAMLAAAPQPEAQPTDLWAIVEASVSEVAGGDGWVQITIDAKSKPAPHLKSLLADKVALLAAQKGGV